MKLIPLTQGKFAQVDDEDYDWLSRWNWFYKRGYAARSSSQKTVFMHREIMKTPNDMETDHKNENGEKGGLNNQRYNLRICTHSQNRTNRGYFSNNKTGYKGVSWENRRDKWHVQIQKDGKKIHEFYEDIVEAARAYDRLACELHGKFAKTNF